MKCFLYLFTISLLTTSSLTVCAGGFWNMQNQYKGFYWFETLRKAHDKKEIQKYQIPTAMEAESFIEERKKRLDDARFQMIAIAFDKNAPEQVKREAVISYKKLEIEMWDGALSLVEASDMANFTNPEIVDNLSQPTNVFGIKLKRRIDAEKSALKILDFSKDFDLLLFADSSCPYSREFIPVLKRVVHDNQFKLEIVSLDSDIGNVAKSLGITTIPTLVAIKKDGAQLFEVARGMVSQTQLEENILFAQKYSIELSQQKNKQTFPSTKKR